MKHSSEKLIQIIMYWSPPLKRFTEWVAEITPQSIVVDFVF